MVERGIQKIQIQQTIDVSQKTLYNKLKGHSPFTWPEVQQIRQTYFPDMGYDELFKVRE